MTKRQRTTLRHISVNLHNWHDLLATVVELRSDDPLDDIATATAGIGAMLSKLDSALDSDMHREVWGGGDKG